MTDDEFRRRIARAIEEAERAAEAAERVRDRIRLRCVECWRPWSDPDERFRALLTAEDPGTFIALYCPECAAYQFD